MLNNLNIFYKKKILIYGLGKSGLSAYEFLKKDNRITTYDDKRKSGLKKVTRIEFDYFFLRTLKLIDHFFLGHKLKFFY